MCSGALGGTDTNDGLAGLFLQTLPWSTEGDAAAIAPVWIESSGALNEGIILRDTMPQRLDLNGRGLQEVLKVVLVAQVGAGLILQSNAAPVLASWAIMVCIGDASILLDARP